ncbi:hypothetical protein [Kibdelosporangium persicum]|uniref:hypothetical protein n=1 Tax=Kibdelosporangium persicum TaxID=2698649 RepID=UPI001563AF42|nr:hypothetical protein [Kibdelosporangium persicum]
MAGSEAALTELSTLDDVLDHCHRYHATRAEPMRELGHSRQAQAAERRALELIAPRINRWWLPTWSSSKTVPSGRRTRCISMIAARSSGKPHNPSAHQANPSTNARVNASKRLGPASQNCASCPRRSSLAPPVG